MVAATQFAMRGCRHPGGVGVLLGDGAAQCIREVIDPWVPTDMASCAGGEVVTIE